MCIGAEGSGEAVEGKIVEKLQEETMGIEMTVDKNRAEASGTAQLS